MKFSARMRVGLMAGACSIAGVSAISPTLAQDTAVDRAANSKAAAAAGAPGAVAATPPDCSANPAVPGCIPASTPSDAPPPEAIIVTGSRIARPNMDSSAPIASISGNEFFQTGNINIGDKLNQLPELHQTFNSSNSTRFIGTQGLNVLDLRGLGTNRTLVLIDGRRQVTSALLLTGTEVDINTIPTDLIERVDVETGGASSVYGSDAIAGVVNFVLKQDYDGFQVKGQGGVSSHKDGASYYLSALAGKNFADGRGNIALNVEYAKQNPILASDRKHFSTDAGFVQTDSDPATALNGSDGIPDYTFYNGLTSAVISSGGTVENLNSSPITPYIFLPNGTLVPQTGARVGLSGNSFLNSNGGSTFKEGDQIYLVPKEQRLIGNVIAHYDFSDSFKPYFEGKYAHTHTVGTQSGPSFIERGGVLGDPREIFHTDNPYLTPQALGIIRSIYPDGTLDGGDGVNDADEYGFFLNRNNVDLGSRVDDTRRNLWRIVVGAKGDIATNLSYDVSANYSHFHEFTKSFGNLDVQRFLLSIDAVRDPATGNIVCRAQIDPAAQIAYSSGGEKYLNNDVSSCVPIDLFGNNAPSAAAKAYVDPVTTSVARASQLDIIGSINYNTGAFLNLPGGPISFAFGGEYRRETQFQAFDDLVQSGVTFSNIIPTFDPPSLKVYEGFGEVDIPVIRDRPFFNKLLLNSAFRVSHYEGNAGTVVAYNGGGQWAPIKDITFRANYSRAVRAPALTETYGVQSQNFATVDDPCAADHIGEGTSTRADNCAAAGVPKDFNYVYTSSLEIVSGGNRNLKAETSDSLTLGTILQPRFIPGLTATFDYYNITVHNVIAAPSAQDILNACYDASTLSNQFCGLFQRDDASGSVTGTPFRVIEGSLQQTLLNYAKLKVRGVDAEISYNRSLGNDWSISLDLKATRNIQNDQYLFPNDPSRPDQLLEELSYPKWQGNMNASIKKGKVSVGYQVRYIGKAVPDQIEDIKSVGGEPPQNADYTSFDYYKAVWYHDIHVGFDATDKFNIYAGVDNVTNKLPPFYLTGVGGGSGIYDNRGRYFSIGVTAKY